MGNFYEPDVAALLADLLVRVQGILGDRFVGLYLYGSLATGDFDPLRSDIDFLVVTDGMLTEQEIARLEQMHQDLWSGGSKWAAKLEGMVLPRQELRRYRPDNPPCPAVNEGKFYLAPQGVDWVIQRDTLRNYETIIAGPSLKEWIDPVSPDELRSAVRDLLQEWWAPILEDPARLTLPEYQPYAVLSMCRARCLLELGKVVSKEAAAQWAMRKGTSVSALEPAWGALIRDALAWRRGDPEGNIEQTLAFIAMTIANSR